MTEAYPKLPENEQRQSANLGRAQSEATAMGLAPEATAERMPVPPTETLGAEEFMHERANTLRGTWFNKAKALAARAEAFIDSIEYGGYNLPPAEKRFNGFAADRIIDDMPKYYGSRTKKDSDTSSDADIAKIARHEMAALPMVRTSGLMALHGAASDRMSVKTSPVTNMRKR